jgi:hypothetical protein
MKTPQNGTPFIYSVYQNNSVGTKASGKYYGRSVILSTLDTEDMAEHMMDHGCLYGQDVIKGVLEKFFDCAMELVFQNRRVKMTGLGTLGITLECEPQDTVDKDHPYDITKIKAAHIRLLPDATQDQQLSGKKLRSRMNFVNGASSSFVDVNAYGGGEEEEEEQEP